MFSAGGFYQGGCGLLPLATRRNGFAGVWFTPSGSIK